MQSACVERYKRVHSLNVDGVALAEASSVGRRRQVLSGY